MRSANLRKILSTTHSTRSCQLFLVHIKLAIQSQTTDAPIKAQLITELNYTLPFHWLKGRRLCIRTMKRTVLYSFHQPMRSGHTIPTQTVVDLKLSSIPGMIYCSPARKKYRPKGSLWGDMDDTYNCVLIFTCTLSPTIS